MVLKKKCALIGIMVYLITSASPEPVTEKLKFTGNTSNAVRNTNPNGFGSIFSPRMDFDQWKPLTGRGDPLHNDPTYDYEPPVLEKVHYWADDSRVEREKNPERKSEVLMLGISSRKPSVASRPPIPPKRYSRPPIFTSKYEDFSYKFGNHFPMTILVPPPPPPPGHKPSLFTLSQEKVVMPTTSSKFIISNPTPIITRDTTAIPETITSYDLEEANLIYHVSTTQKNWFHNDSKPINIPHNTVSSEYAGWGPTTPYDDLNETNNLISHQDQQIVELTKEPLFYYKPVLSEAPPPPPLQARPTNPIVFPTFLSTVLPPTFSNTQMTWPSQDTTTETSTETTNYSIETTTEKITTESLHFIKESISKPKPNGLDMLGSMIFMPMVTDPDRPEDNLYAHASDTIQIFKDPAKEDTARIEIMQTMQPPPPVTYPERQTTPKYMESNKVNPHYLNSKLSEKPVVHTHDPYLHMRFTTPMSIAGAASLDNHTTTKTETSPSYLIIQGHSKVKTYGSKPNLSGTVTNEILNPKENTEVKHLHPIKDKYLKKVVKIDKNREGRAQNLKSLVDNGLGSIEIQEADVGIKYDVSDGSKVPVEIYRKGIVDNDENYYSKIHRKENRRKRQIVLNNVANALSFNKDSLDIVFNQSNRKKIGIIRKDDNHR